MGSDDWHYEEAFRRNSGLITAEEQQRLRTSRVAIAGMGGVGGIHLITLARLGIGQFTIADPDVFELANVNRQYGATIQELGRGKCEVMTEAALEVNPKLMIRPFAEAIGPKNMADFLQGADVVIDGLDFFNIEARRLLFREANDRNIWAVTAGPFGFGTAWLVFDPHGMTFDEYFDLRDEMSYLDKLVAFAVGAAPRTVYKEYLDMSKVDVENAVGPSVALACHLASGVVAAEVLKIVLSRGTVLSVPWYSQFDVYMSKFYRGYLRRGNRGIRQRVKRWWLQRKFRDQAGKAWREKVEMPPIPNG